MRSAAAPRHPPDGRSKRASENRAVPLAPSDPHACPPTLSHSRDRPAPGLFQLVEPDNRFARATSSTSQRVEPKSTEPATAGTLEAKVRPEPSETAPMDDQQQRRRSLAGYRFVGDCECVRFTGGAASTVLQDAPSAAGERPAFPTVRVFAANSAGDTLCADLVHVRGLVLAAQPRWPRSAPQAARCRARRHRVQDARAATDAGLAGRRAHVSVLLRDATGATSPC